MKDGISGMDGMKGMCGTKTLKDGMMDGRMGGKMDEMKDGMMEEMMDEMMDEVMEGMKDRKMRDGLMGMMKMINLASLGLVLGIGIEVMINAQEKKDC